MSQQEATLLEILDNREARVALQSQLLSRFGKPLVCFTMNIPGPVKYSGLIHDGFRLGCRMLEDLLTCAGIPVLHRQERCAVTGCEGYYIVDGDPRRVKTLTMELEDGVPVGRLFDLDVLAPGGGKFSREDLGAEPRKCLICHRSSRICGPVRAHSVDQLQARARELLTDAVCSHRAQTIGALAVRSLLYEVAVTPKPGLVDRLNSGAHRDMDFYSFLSSAAALQPYFGQCARIGLDTRALPPEETFAQIRFHGKLAEQTMLRATGGVNTHKGAVFLMGIACAAAGRLSLEDWAHPEVVLAQCAELTRGLVARDLGHVTPDNARTPGERFYIQYGVTGIRGQAEAGFPAVLDAGLPTLERGLAAGLSCDRAGGAALLALIAATDDTNLISRGSRETQLHIQKMLARLLSETPWPSEAELTRLDREFTGQNLSPGGSADLLALTLFVHQLRQHSV